MGEKNCRSDKNRQAKNGGVEGGSWWERDPHEEVCAGEILTGKLVGVRSSRGSWWE